jgi:hypothetical protein
VRHGEVKMTPNNALKGRVFEKFVFYLIYGKAPPCCFFDFVFKKKFKDSVDEIAKYFNFQPILILSAAINQKIFAQHLTT